jgi:hypothetical protein
VDDARQCVAQVDARRKAHNMSQVARLKITLDRVTPQVFRRIEVPVDIALESLHLVIQIAMGWQNCHLYEFRTPQGGWSNTDPDFGMPDALSAEETALAELLRRGGAKTFRYHYDFGDDWEHTVKVEAVTEMAAGTRYPRLLQAKRACPPEDCGGPWGYVAYLAALSDPEHEQHEEMKDWYGADFDPTVVDEVAIRKQLEALAWARAPRKVRGASNKVS